MRYILGGGISGLIAAFFNPEYKIITDQIGGFALSEYGKQSVFIQDTEESRMLLNLLSIESKSTEIPVCYIKDNEVIEPTQEQKKELIEKKMFDLEKSEQFFVNHMYKENFKLANESKTGTLKILAVGVDILIKRLSEKLSDRIIIDRIELITDDTLIGNDTYEYRKIISTIPAPIFWQIYHGEFLKPQKLKSMAITAVCSKECKHSRIKEKQITYAIGEKYTKVFFDGEKYFYEFSGNLTEEKLKSLGFDIQIESIEYQDHARLEDTFGNIAPRNIIFLGRFAEWKKDFRIEDCIKKSLEKYETQEIWSAQKAFNQNFIEYTSDIQKRQQITKDYILHLFSETEELLDTLNWKMNKKEKKIDYDELKEEWIDAFKFWLSIGILWDISPEDFTEAFWKKTNKLEKAMKEN